VSHDAAISASQLLTHELPSLLSSVGRITGVPGCVDLWAVHLRPDSNQMPRYRAMLSAAELMRADRFVFDRDRNRFIAAHVALRHLLARYTNSPPDRLQFEIGEAGKPALAPYSASQVTFNLSHSDDRAVVAISTATAVGIDLERVRTDLDVMDLSKRYFFGAEYAALSALPAALRHQEFFRYWVAKEAVLKGEGLGIGFALDRFALQFRRGELRATIATPIGAPPAADWQIEFLAYEIGWSIAVAARGVHWSVRLPSLTFE
jgi:4'-phosphopantetheinyl transferase